MPNRKIEFHNAECSACHKKHVDIRTEIIAPSQDKPNAIRKKIIFRCKDHLICDADEMEKLSAIKGRAEKGGFDEYSDVEITTCKSPHDPAIGAHVGIKIKHKPSNIVVISVDKSNQYANKTEAIEKLKLELVKRRFQNFDEGDLVDGNTFLRLLEPD